jgi:hypothetical protein
MKASTDRRGGLRVARKADFMADLQETVAELVRYRRTSPREIRHLVNRTIGECQAANKAPTTRTQVGPFSSGGARSQGR